MILEDTDAGGFVQRGIQIGTGRRSRRDMDQVNFYMDQHNARHGFILSDIELIAIKRFDRNGRLAVATPAYREAEGLVNSRCY